MASYKFKVGQIVNFTPARTTMSASSPEYTIVRLLPRENGHNQYRIKGTNDTFERMARETDLTAISA